MPSHAHRCLQTIRLPTFCRWWATSVPSDILVSLEWLCWWRLRLRYLDVWCLRVEMLPIITLRAIRTNGTWGHLTIMICVFPACERWAFYPNLMRWRNAALNWRMTDVQESSEQQNGIKDSSSKVNRWLRLPRVSIMPLVFEGYPWLLYSRKLSELRNGNIHLKDTHVHRLFWALTIFYVPGDLLLQWENSEGAIWTIIQQTQQQTAM